MAAQFSQLPAGALGANIEHLTQLSSHLRSSIEQLENVFKQIDGKITQTVWSGNDAKRTADNWNATRQSTMSNMRAMLDSMSNAIKMQAAEQQNTSNA